MPLHSKMIHSPFKKLNKNLYMISELKSQNLFFHQGNLRKQNCSFCCFPYDKEYFMNFLFSLVLQVFSVNFISINCLCCLSHSFANTIKILLILLTWNISSNTTPSFNVKSCSASKDKYIPIMVITISMSVKCNLR